MSLGPILDNTWMARQLKHLFQPMTRLSPLTLVSQVGFTTTVMFSVIFFLEYGGEKVHNKTIYRQRGYMIGGTNMLPGDKDQYYMHVGHAGNKKSKGRFEVLGKLILNQCHLTLL